jgi:peptide/nickel transport system ATP-binding protein
MTAVGLSVEGLSLDYAMPRGTLQALRDVSFSVAPGDLLALVGESGSGKSTIGFACAGWMAPNARRIAGRILIDGQEVTARDRGRRVAMVFQDPGTALNPAMRLIDQVTEVLRTLRGMDAGAAEAEAMALMARVRLPDADRLARRFPHEVSGGEKQRVLIAMALAARPRLLVCDEPTTALDATTAIGILDLIAGLRRDEGLAVLYITHDLGIAAQVADRAAVLYAGRVVERGGAATVLRVPTHPYTRLLLHSLPDPHGAERRLPAPLPGGPPDLRRRPQGCVFVARCPIAAEACDQPPPTLTIGDHEVSCCRIEEARELMPPQGRVPEAPTATGPLLAVEDLVVTHGRRRLFSHDAPVRAVAGISFEIGAGECFALIGESGCGKSSALRALSGLSGFAGDITFDGRRLQDGAAFPKAWRQSIQLIFQQPDQSLNPRLRIGTTLGRPLALYHGMGGAALRREVAAWLERVRLPASYATRFPHELSGGEKQRVAIARAFAARPRLVLCDEVTSGLDVSVQAAILDLLAQLRQETGVALLMVAHDLNMVQQFADRVAVMYLGRIMELRTLRERFASPMHPYAEALLAAAPVPDPAISVRRLRLEGSLPSPAAPPPGCPFVTRCPRRIGPLCDKPPPWRPRGNGQGLLCHIPLNELTAVPPIWQRADGRQD